MVETRPPIQPEAPRPSYDTPMTRLQPTVAASLQQAIAALPPPPSNDEEPSAVEGEACKNNGCKLTYSADRVANECIYHPGIPVFHEGMKYWSCCQRKTTEFQEFMDQAGCETGNCKWVADKKGGLKEPNHSLNNDVLCLKLMQFFHNGDDMTKVKVFATFPHSSDLLNIQSSGKEVECRYDWHQTASHVTTAVYAKK